MHSQLFLLSVDESPYDFRSQLDTRHKRHDAAYAILKMKHLTITLLPITRRLLKTSEQFELVLVRVVYQAAIRASIQQV